MIPHNHTRLPRRCQLETLEPRQLYAAGALDRSFSEDGRQALDFGSGRTIHAADVALQQDGKTVIVGTARDPAFSARFDFAVARLNRDGTPDTTFGSARSGLVITRVGDGAEASAAGVAIQADGRIVVVGTAEVNDGAKEDEIAIARYLPSGTLDKSFDGDGVRTLDVGNFDSFNYGHDVAVQPDGKIVLVGMTYRAPGHDFAVLRFNPNGSLDGSFDGDGKKFIGFGNNDAAHVVALGPGGTIYLAGQVDTDFNQTQRIGVVRLNRGGSGIASFDGDAKAVFALPGRSVFVAGLLPQADGGVIVAGHTAGTGAKNDLLVARYTVEGKLDKSFGGEGTGFALTDLGGNDFAGGIIAAPDGGGGFIVSGGSGGFAAAKYTAAGRLDPSFGVGGKVRLGSGGVARVARGPGKRFTLAGGDRFASARLLDAGANVVSVSPLFDSAAHEQGRDPTTVFVYRSERLPFETRVYLRASGTATGQTVTLPGRPNPTDYTGWSNSFLTIDGRGPHVVIPANQTFTTITITPVDDDRPEGLETVVFEVLPDAAYDIGLRTATFTIFDNDGTALGAVADAYVRDGAQAGTNFGAATDLQVKGNTPNFNRETFLKFDLSNVGTINSAKLRLFGQLSGTESQSVRTEVFSVANSSWTESGITFNNRPASGATALAGAAVFGTGGRYYDFDLTSYLRAEKAAGKRFVSIVLRNPASSQPFVGFNSREAAADLPQLVIS